MTEILFRRDDARLGRFELRHIDPVADAPLLLGWLTHPKSVFWMMQDARLSDVERAYGEIAASEHHAAYLGLHRGIPKFLVERYDPAHSELAGRYAAEPGDVGMHFLTAPADAPEHGFTLAVLVTIMEMLFADPATRRVVVEPDVRNAAVHRLNAAVGFRIERELPLHAKTAYLSTCTRAAVHPHATPPGARLMNHPADAVAHLTPEHWERANRHLVRKALTEFAHERLITPQSHGSGRYRVLSDDRTAEYVFRADRLALDHWRIDAASIVRRGTASGETLPLDAVDLILDLRHGLSLTPNVLPVYLEEISSTLASAAFKLAAAPVSAGELARADFQAVESGMTEGHPCFVANNGRLGFDAVDYVEYAPEAGQSTQLIWVAARRERTTFAASEDLEYEALMHNELGSDTLARFAAKLSSLGLDPDDYLLIPVHPWQWRNKLAVTYAGDLARRDLVCLGHGEDTYRPQQSIRTFFNTAAPRKHYVKTALSILNMGFMRGLSADYMQATPAINDWLDGLIAADPVLTGAGFGILRERAAIGYRQAQYAVAGGKGSPYLKMLAALWRESPVPRLGPGERVTTMAALLHVDRDGESLAAALIAGSGCSAEEWLRGYLDAYLVPVLHSFYEYGLVYMPHGENVILVLDDAGNVLRVLFKDIAEEIAVLDPATPLPPRAERIRAEVPGELRVLSIFTDVFDCFLRFLAATLDETGAVSEAEFWAVVGDCVADYQQANPHLGDRFEAFDLFVETFPLSCLNRLQLRDNRQMVDLEDPASALQLAGTLVNPIAGHRRDRRTLATVEGGAAA